MPRPSPGYGFARAEDQEPGLPRRVSGLGLVVRRGRGARTMFNLSRFSLSDMIECGGALRQLGQGKRSMEEVAECIVRYLYDHLVDGRTGERACALVRFFKTHPYGGLDEDLRCFAREMLGRPPESPALKCLTLLATAGDRPEWNRRERSQKHQAIPLPSEERLHQTPMIAQLIGQFGLEAGVILRPDPDVLLDREQRTYNVFHIARRAAARPSPPRTSSWSPLGSSRGWALAGCCPRGICSRCVYSPACPSRG